MKKLSSLLFSIGLLGAINVASATNLIDVFHQAQDSDPSYQKAKATYLAEEATLGQARSAFLPNLSLTGSYTQTKTKTVQTGNYTPTIPATPDSTTNLPLTTTVGALSLTQSLFDWASFKTYAKAKLDVKQAALTYAAAEQDLMLRTASAYFDVLTAQDILRYTASQKKQLARNLEVTRQRYRVGLDAITSVYDALAKYDATKASYIAKENDLADKKEALREITGQLYPSIYQLKKTIPLVSPQPSSIDAWTKAAEEQNVTLMAARLGAQSAAQNVKIQFAGHLPTLALAGSYTDTNNKNTDVTNGTSDADTSSLGVTLTVPIFAGGNVSYQTKQAEYQYQAAVADMDIQHRSTLAQTRKAYLGVLAEISQIRADRQAIKSAQSSLASNNAAYKVGTRTILDVLTAQSALYDAETKYAQDRFEYVINFLTLKEASGTLNEQDLAQVNTWLTRVAYKAPIKHTARKTRVVKHAVKKAPKKIRQQARKHSKTQSHKVVHKSTSKKA